MNTEEFEKVMKEQRPYMVWRATEQLHSVALAEELVQEAMIDVWTYIKNGLILESESIEGAFFRTVLWRLGDSRKSNRVRSGVMVQFTVPPRKEDYEVEEESEAVEYYEKPWIYHPDGSEANLQLDVHKALNALNDTERLIATRHYLEGWTYAELAEEDGRTWQAVKGQLNRIAMKLRKTLAEYRSVTSSQEYI